jgi:bifunctional NMN adenylyltransferase/nudix hydrolase
MKRALEAGNQLLVIVGSANQPRTVKNPWTVSEVEVMIKSSLPEDVRERVMVLPLRDTAYNDQAWVQQVQDKVRAVTEPADVVGLIGHSKDESSYYLKMFPQWDHIEMENINDIHATDIRNAYFEANGDMTNFDFKIGRNLPPAIHDFMKAFAHTSDYETLVNEYKFLVAHAKMWEDAPYPPMFITTDAVVVQSGHVLLVKRRAEPGKNLWAIPGGYLNQKEYIIDGLIRELREETMLKVPGPVLRGSIKYTGVYDAPDRSPRGRIVTHASLIELPAGPLPPVKGSDDAEKAKWIPLSVFERMEEQMFEDHFHIIRDLLGKM